MEQQQDFLQEVETEMYYERVSAGTRFANYIIDVVVFYVLAFIGGMVIGALGLYTQRFDEYTGKVTTSGDGIFYLIGIMIFLGYYTICEGASKGRTLGKLITGSRVVMADGSPITWKAAFLRSLSRMVPFEPFSAFSGNPWHDQWTNTQVIKNRK